MFQEVAFNVEELGVVMTPNQRCNGIQDLVEPDAGLEFKFHEPGQVKPGNLKARDLGAIPFREPFRAPFQQMRAVRPFVRSVIYTKR